MQAADLAFERDAKDIAVTRLSTFQLMVRQELGPQGPDLVMPPLNAAFAELNKAAASDGRGRQSIPAVALVPGRRDTYRGNSASSSLLPMLESHVAMPRVPPTFQVNAYPIAR